MMRVLRLDKSMDQPAEADSLKAATLANCSNVRTSSVYYGESKE
jgi:hypothetical protein